jgi:thiamine-phosphate pyrophosphorylase
MRGLAPGSLRVYVVTSASFAGRTHRDVAAAAIEGGATAIQLRAPELSDDDLLPIARDLATRCAAADVLFVVNDRPRIAAASGAGGAHLGQRDDLDGARAALGPDRVLGISVTTPAEARAAVERGADYLGVTVWATVTKPEASPGGLDLVRDVVAASSVPVVGIGGIDPGNAGRVIAAGASGVAVISAVAASPDPVEATRRLARAVGVDRTPSARRPT